jgi:predicted enzyme related to lactoylglutathione lyase
MLANARGALVAIQARDFERAVTFYTAVLGLEMTFRHENFWAEFRAPGLTLGVSAASDGTVVGGGTTTVCFEIADIQAAAGALRSRGVSFAGPIVEKFHGLEAYFADSEGNPLMLHQSTMAAPAPAPRTARGARPSPPRGSKPTHAKPARRGPSSASKGRKAAPKSSRSAPPRRGRGKKGKR